MQIERDITLALPRPSAITRVLASRSPAIGVEEGRGGQGHNGLVCADCYSPRRMHRREPAPEWSV